MCGKASASLDWHATQTTISLSPFNTHSSLYHNTLFSLRVIFPRQNHLLGTRQSKEASCLLAFLSSKRDGVPFNPTVKTCTRRWHPLWYAVLTVHCYLSVELSFLSSQLDLSLPKVLTFALGSRALFGSLHGALSHWVFLTLLHEFILIARLDHHAGS